MEEMKEEGTVAKKYSSREARWICRTDAVDTLVKTSRVGKYWESVSDYISSLPLSLGMYRQSVYERLVSDAGCNILKDGSSSCYIH